MGGDQPYGHPQNEWLKAKRLKEAYYLYSIMNIDTRPVLYVVRNPSENLGLEEMLEAIRYLVGYRGSRLKGK